LGTDARASTPGTTAEAGADEPPLRLRGDEAALFAEHGRELIEKLTRSVRATPADVEDACSFAWVQFMRHQPSRDRAWQGWLFRTAQREAWRLTAQHRSELGIVAVDELNVGTVLEPPDPRDRSAERLEFQAALQEVRKLPEQMQAVVLWRSQLATQEEVGEVLGISRQRVAQVLQAASGHLAELSERRIEADRPVASPRAARLRELEDDPPAWLADAVGTPPTRSKSASASVLAWRRAALAIDDYRRVQGYDSPTDAIGAAPTEPAARRCFERAQRTIEESRYERVRRHKGLGLGR
jgi:DNA-directed RNA polymerase specialized sigma24 family protein